MLKKFNNAVPNWSNLRDGKCPNCGGKLKLGLMDSTMKCFNGSCNFEIGSSRYVEIISDMSKPKVRRCAFGDNFADLQNLGHKGITKDFSDSPHLT